MTGRPGLFAIYFVAYRIGIELDQVAALTGAELNHWIEFLRLHDEGLRPWPVQRPPTV